METTATSPDRIFFCKYEEIEELYILNNDEGISLSLEQFEILKSKMNEIESAIPEIFAIKPCYLREDHQNVEGSLMCSECYPSGLTI
ncbi:hypothetical protein HC928_08530 [bacterium]|nr:hypothetical protein [bacterium]